MADDRRIDADDVADLWLAMARLYGHRWTSNYGTSDRGDMWLRVLGDLMPAQLAQGIAACCRRGDPWPPSAPEFRALALGLPAAVQIAAAAQDLAAGCAWRVPAELQGFARAALAAAGVTSWDAGHLSAQELQRRLTAAIPGILGDEAAARIEDPRRRLEDWR
ncbi:MAG: hypothetical protein ACRCV5_10365 [Afipia sp.]